VTIFKRYVVLTQVIFIILPLKAKPFASNGRMEVDILIELGGEGY
jgi:hypothetical protein